MGYPTWFLYVTGVIEVVGAILLLIPKTAVFGVLLLGATMIGIIGWLRQDQLRKLLGK